MKDIEGLYTDDYFNSRNSNDVKRLRSFEDEWLFMKNYVDNTGVVCDVGCSTGEFLLKIKWQGMKYGMEVNQGAINIAESKGISFDKNILTDKNFFDVIIFRGTIQHVPDPFGYVALAFEALKPGGKIIFLATPNANSICFKIFNTLPMLDPKLNFYIPSDVTLTNILNMFNFSVIKVDFPYRISPYSNYLMDHLDFLKSIIFRRPGKHAFWKNMMNVIAFKPMS